MAAKATDAIALLKAVHEEERPKDGMSAKAQARDVDLVTLGAAMAARNAQPAAQLKADGLPIPTAHTLKPVERRPGEPVA